MNIKINEFFVLIFCIALNSILQHQIQLVECSIYSTNRKQNFFFQKPKNILRKQASKGTSIISQLDVVRSMFINGLEMINMHLTQNINDNVGYQDKMQSEITEQERFPCNLTNARSSVVPDSVDRLRPGDIDVVAVLGDSLSAGMGTISKHIFDVLIAYPGIAFTGGGFGDWKKYLTLPNILKVFNPNLHGFSTQPSGLYNSQSSDLNIAKPAIMARDLVSLSHQLIDRMKQDAHVDMQKHWKLVTVFVGANDICSDMCFHDSAYIWLKSHESVLHEALNLLKANIPRLIVNLMPAPNMILFSQQLLSNVPATCKLLLPLMCPCVISDSYTDSYRNWLSQNIQQWQAIDKYVAELPEFHTQDFAVIYQPFMANASIPTASHNYLDLRYLAADCFHFSQLGHAVTATALWNNMLQKANDKQLGINALPFEQFECPSDARPYIATK